MIGLRLAVVLLVGVAACGALGACGGDDGEEAAGTTASSEPAAAPDTTAAEPDTTRATTTTLPTATSGASSTSAAAVAADAVLVVQNYQFAPLSVPAGSVVRLENRESEPHNISSPDGSIDYDAATETFTAPATAGTYDYVCGIHAFMEGTLTVT